MAAGLLGVVVMIYFERVTQAHYPAQAHIQTPCDPLHAADEFSWDHPEFRGPLEVIMQQVAEGRPLLTSVLIQIDGPGHCSLAPKLEGGRRGMGVGPCVNC